MNGESDNKQEAGVSYPYCPLSIALPVAEAIRALGGSGSPVSRSLLASTLKEDEQSQTLLFKIGAAKVFGIIEGRTDLRLTDAGKKYFSPTIPNGKQIMLLEFLERPRAFRLLIQRFDGSKLPDTEIMGNILNQEGGVPESWQRRVASSFVKSAQYASAIDAENYLRVKASRESWAGGKSDTGEKASGAPDAVVRPSIEPPTGDDGKSKSPKDENVHTYVLPLPNKRRIVVEAPLDITMAEISRLQKWVEFTLFLEWKDDEKAP